MHYKKLRVNGKLIDEHVYIWVLHFGDVPEGYVVHHKDGNPHNNDISNLEIMQRAEHSRMHRINSHLTSATKEKLSSAAKRSWNMRLSTVPQGFSICCKCHATLPTTDFNKDKYTRLGIKSICKECRKTSRRKA